VAAWPLTPTPMREAQEIGDTKPMPAASQTRQERTDPAAIWLRQPGEPAKAYGAFVVYRDLSAEGEGRSLRAVAMRLDRGVRVLQEWSSRWNWVERADAYLGHLDAIRVAEHEDDIVRQRREHNEQLRELGRQLRAVALARLIGGTIGSRFVASIDPSELTPTELVRFASLGARLERTAMGLPPDFLRGAGQITLADFQHMLTAFLGLAEKRMRADDFHGFIRDCDAMVRARLGG